MLKKNIAPILIFAVAPLCALSAAGQTAAPTPSRHIFSSPRAKQKNKPVAADAEKSAAKAKSDEILNETPTAAPENTGETSELKAQTLPSETVAAAPDAEKVVNNEPSAAPIDTAAINAGETIENSAAKSVVAPHLTATNAAEIYRVGAGDVLDIKLLNSNDKNSTLFTVLENGTLDYPLAGEPMRAAGLTVDEINAALTRAVSLYEKPEFVVGVREYASHQITLSGLVERGGAKILRREAVPLYAVLAEAGQLPTATKAVIRRAGQENQTIILKDLSNDTLVFAGDFVQVTNEPLTIAPQFYFIAGAVVAPGQKDFHHGLTLTQAIFASGGASGKNADRVTILRQNAEGLLVSTEYNLKEIKKGKVADPSLQPGDRIEIGN